MTITALVHQLNSRDFLLHLTPLWVLSMLINRSPVRCRRRGGERSVLHYWMLSKPPDSLFFIMSRCLWGSQQSTQTVRWFGASSSSFMDTVKLLSLRDSAKLFLHVQNTAANALIIWHFFLMPLCLSEQSYTGWNFPSVKWDNPRASWCAWIFPVCTIPTRIRTASPPYRAHNWPPSVRDELCISIWL